MQRSNHKRTKRAYLVQLPLQLCMVAHGGENLRSMVLLVLRYHQVARANAFITRGLAKAKGIRGWQHARGHGNRTKLW